MIEYLEIVFIAIVQGIGEFLPISSSGHLVVTNHLFERFGKALTADGSDFIKLNVLLHVGTLFAVFIVFRQRIMQLFGKDRRLIPLLIVGTLPAVVIGLGIKKNADWISNDLYITGGAFLLTGLLLLVSLRYMNGEKVCSEMTWADALFIGIFQSVAILPGLSRSGSTIVAGLLRKMKRDEAAAFSFLLSIPVIAGGGILELKDLFDQSSAGETHLSTSLLLLGLVVSCLVGILALSWLLHWLQKGRLWYFALWVFLMSPLTLLLAHTNPDRGNGTVTPSLQKSEADVNAPVGETLSDSQQSSIASESQSKNEIADEKDIRDETAKLAERTNETSPPDADRQDDRSEITSLNKAIEETKPSPLDMTREEAQEEYERILAEEEAAEQAFIEEERKRIPLVENPDKLILLDPQDRIWITPDGKSVVLLGRVALREGLLELLACRIGTKEHESIISVRIKPFLIHAALLAVNAEPGKPVQVVPKFVPASGEAVEILVRWQTENGETRESLAQDWVLDLQQSTETEKKSMASDWVFSGSMTYKDESGENHYVADESGELIGLSNFVGSILDVPFQSSDSNADLLFSCYTERIPELHTPLTVLLTPVKNKKR